MDCRELIEDAANEVAKTLGPFYSPYSESSYESALALELRLRGVPYDRQRNMEILYKGNSLAIKRSDLVLFPARLKAGQDEYLVELKWIPKISKDSIKQAQVYLYSMNIDKGLIVNFNKKTHEVELEDVTKPDRKCKTEICVPPKKRRSSKELNRCLKKAGQEVINYLGSDFFYYEGGKQLYIDAVGVDLRLMGVDYHASSHDILYKGQLVASYDYDYVLNGESTAKILVYSKEEALDEAKEELAGYNKLFGFRQGFVLGIPAKEDLKVVVKEV